METIFQNTENIKTNESNKFIYQCTDKRNLKTPNNKIIGLANLSIYYTWKNIKSAYNNNKFKISASTWNDEFDSPDDSYYISDIEDYFELIIKKHETLVENPPIKIYTNKFKNRIVFKTKTGYKQKMLTPETMKLLESTKKDVDKDKYGEVYQNWNLLKFVLMDSNLFNNSYQQASKLLCTLVSNKHKNTNTEFYSIQLSFTDQNNIPKNAENTLKDTAFCCLQEGLVTNMVKN